MRLKIQFRGWSLNHRYIAVWIWMAWNLNHQWSYSGTLIKFCHYLSGRKKEEKMCWLLTSKFTFHFHRLWGGGVRVCVLFYLSLPPPPPLLCTSFSLSFYLILFCDMNLIGMLMSNNNLSLKLTLKNQILYSGLMTLVWKKFEVDIGKNKSAEMDKFINTLARRSNLWIVCLN